ncbi:hypothetical protein ACZ91_64690 [Streptomyces regensis]|nr:hypothetical protein ACZ91_64690 [Streptomyces regensis]
MEATLQIGEYDAVIERVGLEIVRNPLREGLYRLAMNALLISGREGEALMLYEKARSVFYAELGIGPGASLGDLYGQIMSTRGIVGKSL